MLAVAITAIVAFQPPLRTEQVPEAARAPVHDGRHHYTMNARVRPLLFFWIGKDNVGEATITRRLDANGAGYTLLIGSDPDRAPRHINRWGYIDEQLSPGGARLVGLMTASDEESVSQAEANLKDHPDETIYKVIHGEIAEREAKSVVTAVAASSKYTYRDLEAVLKMAASDGHTGQARLVTLPAGARPGFLAAVADLVHGQVDQWQTQHRVSPGATVTYVYHGKLYQLRLKNSRAASKQRIGATTYDQVIASQFLVKNLGTGEESDFSMTYAADGPLVETPLAISYQPRWFLQVQLTLDDSAGGPSVR